jgi:cellobiose-specific phosphotransferase system component IIB
MIIVLVIITLACLGGLVAALVVSKKLEQKLAAEKQETERLRQYYESETSRVYNEAQVALGEAQRSLDQQSEDAKQDAERVRQHYEAEARKLQQAAEALLAKTIKDFEPLRKYEHLRDAEGQAQHQLVDALKEASALRAEAQSLLDQSHAAAATERSQAAQKAKDIQEQADARLNQAIRDAGRIIAEAEQRAQQIAGDAYTALRDKQVLEQAAEAMRNIIEGYGDRYLVPTHSLLDDLAAEYGYDAAGQSLASAREQCKRMVEQGQAATCEYVEASRRNTAIQFVIHAFNGSVDATLSRVKSDNYGILEQRIKDCYSIVNRDGSAFRNARILPAYLDARLAELKWAVVVQELAQRDREEQRYLREQERDRLKAEQERLRTLQEAEKEKELTRVAVEEAEKRFAAASAEQKAESQKDLLQLRQKLEEATRKELTIAQQTTKGRIYIISNIGSFGEGVYKIGLTRRPANERVDELSGASVPFEFDIHAVIETENAPVLEYKIHQQFLGARINKINLRKEFFRVSLNELRQAVEMLEQGKDFNGAVTWTEKAKAQQYYDSLDIDHDPEVKDKWLKRACLLAERRERATLRSSVAENLQNGPNGQEN